MCGVATSMASPRRTPYTRLCRARVDEGFPAILLATLSRAKGGERDREKEADNEGKRRLSQRYTLHLYIRTCVREVSVHDDRVEADVKNDGTVFRFEQKRVTGRGDGKHKRE